MSKGTHDIFRTFLLMSTYDLLSSQPASLLGFSTDCDENAVYSSSDALRNTESQASQADYQGRDGCQSLPTLVSVWTAVGIGDSCCVHFFTRFGIDALVLRRKVLGGLRFDRGYSLLRQRSACSGHAQCRHAWIHALLRRGSRCSGRDSRAQSQDHWRCGWTSRHACLEV
jgi:hypothetical protein